jgi:hypothetical protein
MRGLVIPRSGASAVLPRLTGCPRAALRRNLRLVPSQLIIMAAPVFVDPGRIRRIIAPDRLDCHGRGPSPPEYADGPGHASLHGAQFPRQQQIRPGTLHLVRVQKVHPEWAIKPSIVSVLPREGIQDRKQDDRIVGKGAHRRHRRRNGR